MSKRPSMSSNKRAPRVTKGVHTCLICEATDTSQWRHVRQEEYKKQWSCNICWQARKPVPSHKPKDIQLEDDPTQLVAVNHTAPDEGLLLEDQLAAAQAVIVQQQAHIAQLEAQLEAQLVRQQAEIDLQAVSQPPSQEQKAVQQAAVSQLTSLPARKDTPDIALANTGSDDGKRDAADTDSTSAHETRPASKRRC